MDALRLREAGTALTIDDDRDRDRDNRGVRGGASPPLAPLAPPDGPSNVLTWALAVE